MSDLLIENVDLSEVRRQRLALHRVLEAAKAKRRLPVEELVHLEGLSAALDAWHDAQDEQGEVVQPELEHLFVVTVSGCSAKQADEVMQMRLGHDENCGFDYTVDYRASS